MAKDIIFYDNKDNVTIMIWREQPEATGEMTIKSGYFVIRLEENEDVIEKKLTVEDIARLSMILKKEVMKDYEELKEIRLMLERRVFGYESNNEDERSYV